ncbi:MAG: hypothetical protein RMK49_02285 [Abditibacteriales bacterium]|nr:hypothetical protein [Abditibacteriales bacterium]
MPSDQEYQMVIQTPSLCFHDPELQGGQVELNQLSLPKPRAGNFATVYQIRNGSRRWAVKCFTRDVADLQPRYDAISRHLAGNKMPFFVEFQYLTSGIRVNGTWYPIVKMEWVEGEPLNQYIKKNLNTPQRLQGLARRFAEMVEALRRAQIIHGDLQHGNILVSSSGDLKLVDYDGMIVPALVGSRNRELGHPNYQHPARTDVDSGFYLDNFSAWVIYLSLIACSLRPDIWHRVNGGDECLLFRKEDFKDPESSVVFAELNQSQDTRLMLLTSQFRSLLFLAPSHIPALDGSVVADDFHKVTSTTRRPSWLDDHVPISISQTQQQSSKKTKQSPELQPPGAIWVLDHLNDSKSIEEPFVLPCVLDRIIFALMIVALVLVASELYSGLITIPLSVSLAATLLFCGGLFAVARYKAAPAVIAKRQLKAKEVEVCRNIREREKALKALKDKRQGLEKRQTAELTNLRQKLNVIAQAEAAEMKRSSDILQRSLNNITSRRQAIAQSEASELKQVNDALQRHLNDLNTRRQNIDSLEANEVNQVNNNLQRTLTSLSVRRQNADMQEAEEIRHALAALQSQYMASKLSQYSIQTMNIYGIGPTFKKRLIAEGIRTAADVDYWRVRRIWGFGDVRTNAVVRWRRRLECEIQPSMSKQLPPNEEQKIRSKYAAQRQTWNNEEQAARQSAQIEKQRVRDKYLAQRNLLNDEERTARQHAQAEEKRIRDKYLSQKNSLNMEEQIARQRHQYEQQRIRNKYQLQRKVLNDQEHQVCTRAKSTMDSIDQQIMNVWKALTEQQWALARIQRELLRYQRVGFAAYLRRVLFFN